MELLAVIIILGGFVAAAHFYWRQMFPAEDAPLCRREFVRWCITGLGMPTLLWLVFNVGSSPMMPPLVGSVALGTVKGGSLGRMAAIMAPAMFIIGSNWLALTMVWLLGVFARRKEWVKEVSVAGAVWSLFTLPVAALIVSVGGWEAAGFAAAFCLAPIVHLAFLEATSEKGVDRRPMYAAAIAKMKFGKYGEAESEVIKELEKYQDDFDGWMMLAELYANHFGDLPEAERTVRELLEQPNATPTWVAVAFHKLADWHLKPGNNPAGARRALEEITRRLPGTHLAHMAGLRLRQLPSSAAEMEEQRKGKTYRMPALQDDGEPSSQAEVPAMERKEAVSQANACVAKLKQDPNDVAVREQLARLLAEQLDKAREGLEQLELLMGMPGQDESKIAGWLALCAAWQTTYLQNADAARACLERLAREYPQSPQAFAAQRRLSLMMMEEKIERFKAAGKRLAYEKRD